MSGTLALWLMAIDPKAVSALRIVTKALVRDRRRFVLIGATVPQILIDIRQGHKPGSRPTRDVDAIVEVTGWEDFRRMRDHLERAGFRAGSGPQEMRFGEQVRIDLIPFGPELVEEDRLVWPQTGMTMSTLGFEEAIQCAQKEELAPGLSVPMVTIPGLVLLKIVAYLDRPPSAGEGHDRRGLLL